VLAGGRIVGSRDKSERFLWDFRRAQGMASDEEVASLWTQVAAGGNAVVAKDFQAIEQRLSLAADFAHNTAAELLWIRRTDDAGADRCFVCNQSDAEFDALCTFRVSGSGSPQCGGSSTGKNGELAHRGARSLGQMRTVMPKLRWFLSGTPAGRLFAGWLLAITTPCAPSAAQIHASWADRTDPDYHNAPPEAVEDWKDLKYGMRIHWGVYSVLGVEASWPTVGASEEFKSIYNTLYQVFNPSSFDADQWASLMIRCGFKYFVFTAKHVDGFAMFDTSTAVSAFRRRGAFLAKGIGEVERVTIPYSIMDAPFQRDIVKELVDAARRRGLGVGLPTQRHVQAQGVARRNAGRLLRQGRELHARSLAHGQREVSPGKPSSGSNTPERG
jgi:hypothetical protein